MNEKEEEKREYVWVYFCILSCEEMTSLLVMKVIRKIWEVTCELHEVSLRSIAILSCLQVNTGTSLTCCCSSLILVMCLLHKLLLTVSSGGASLVPLLIPFS